MWEHFTESSRRAIVAAQEEAQRCGNNYIGSEHLLLGLIAGSKGASKVLAAHGITLERSRAALDEICGAASAKTRAQEMVFTPRAKAALERSFVVARRFRLNCISTGALLLGLLEDDGGVAQRILDALAVDRVALAEDVAVVLQKASPEPPPAAPAPHPWSRLSPFGVRP